jgi:pimeloyl-ACP methyl ester carboxylesterase
MLPDGERIVQALGIPPGRIVAFGRSLGSLYAIELARRLPDLAGIIIESGVADVVDAMESLVGDVAALPFARELVAEIQTYFNVKSSLQNYRGKLLVLHASQDELLPQSHAERLHAWAGGDDKTLVLFPEGNHNSIFAVNYPEYINQVKSFLDRAGVTVPAAPAAS